MALAIGVENRNINLIGVFRFTIDINDRIPVTLGEVRSWAVSQ